MGTLIEAHAKTLHENILNQIGASRKADKPTCVTLFSLHEGEGGQWIIGDPNADRETKLRIAKRLRLAAEILESKEEFV